MLTWHILAAAMLAGPVQGSPYDPPASPPDPIAQRDELIALYDEICLRAFPDDSATAEAAARRGGTPCPRPTCAGSCMTIPGSAGVCAGAPGGSM